MKKAKVLVVDDEPKVIHLVREILNASGYDVVVALNGERAVELAAVEQPDMVILDIMLPEHLDGYDVARRLREFSEVPILMLTARVRETDLLRGFEAGADDYLTKPFSSKELLARMKAVLKRAHKSDQLASASELDCGDLHIDWARHRVTRKGEEIQLTHTEFNLLSELARHPNQVLLHEQLLSAVWGSEYCNDQEYLRAYIRYLRKKIEVDPSNPRIILRCPGVGYSFVCPEEE
jgi:two-component system KDP operon response regulator KdpE